MKPGRAGTMTMTTNVTAQPREFWRECRMAVRCAGACEEDPEKGDCKLPVASAPRSVLQEGRKSVNIHGRSAVIRESRLVCCTGGRHGFA
jgi:hypothetical protein